VMVNWWRSSVTSLSHWRSTRWGTWTPWSWVLSPAAALSVGWYRDGWPSSGGDTISVCNQTPRPTQPPTLCGMGNKYRPKWCDALRLGCISGWPIAFADKRMVDR